MITIAVTGGVACGKSSFCRRFLDWMPEGGAAFFSSDAAVKELSAGETVARRIAELGGGHGRTLWNGEGLDRAAFRELVFENGDFRAKVEALLHPLVQGRLDVCRSNLAESVEIFLVEVPLLYEVDFPLSRDLDVVVGSSPETQEQRLIQSRGLPQGLARNILKSQIPIHEKLRRAHVVVWNDGGLESFHSQADHLALRCQPLFAHDRRSDRA